MEDARSIQYREVVTQDYFVVIVVVILHHVPVAVSVEFSLYSRLIAGLYVHVQFYVINKLFKICRL